MSRKFLTPVQLPVGTNNPTVGHLGALFYRTDLAQLMIFDGTLWTAVGPTAAAVIEVDGGTESGFINVLDGGFASTSTFDAVLDGGNESSF